MYIFINIYVCIYIYVCVCMHTGVIQVMEKVKFLPDRTEGPIRRQHRVPMVSDRREAKGSVG